jgi:hypothetical protein
MPRVLESQAVQRLTGRPHERKLVEDANGARVLVEDLPEVRLAQPAVDVRTDLSRRAVAGTAADRPSRFRQIHLPVSAAAEQIDRRGSSGTDSGLTTIWPSSRAGTRMGARSPSVVGARRVVAPGRRMNARFGI